jgi:GT2 family glycosyltransferase
LLAFAHLNLDIIVVDNCSNDGQLEQFKHQFETVNFVLNAGNYGFAHGCNTGARKAEGEYLLFLNPDTEVHQDVFSPLINELTKLPRFSLVATQKINANGKPERMERFFPRWYTLTGLGKALHRQLNKKQIKHNFASHLARVHPEWLSGSVIFMRTQDWHELDGWNEKFWMYSEDVDLCKRAASKGGVVALLTNVDIIHNHGGSSRINPVTSALTKSEVCISRHVFIDEHFEGASKYLLQALLAIKTLVKMGLLALVSVLLFYHPKARTSRLIFVNLLRYYVQACITGSWISPRSILRQKIN